MATLSLKLKTPYRKEDGTQMYCYRVLGSKSLINSYIADMNDAGTLSQDEDGTPLFHTKYPVLAGTEFVRNAKSGKWYPDNTYVKLIGDLSAQNPSLPFAFIEQQAKQILAEMRSADKQVDASVEETHNDPFADLGE
jgi:hypothetical protein